MLKWAAALGVAAWGAPPADSAVVAPNPASLLKQKRVLVALPTYATDYHPGARAIVTGKIRRIRDAAGMASLVEARGVDTMTLATLNRYDVIVFNYFTKLELLEKTPFGIAFRQWLAAGNRGFVGNHNSGAQSAGEWNWFRDSVQSMRYIDHKDQSQRGTIHVTKDASVRALPVLEGLDASFTGNDEWYSFDMPPRAPAPPTWGDCKPLYYLDETSVTSLTDKMGANHPVAWIREDAKGNRYFYTTLIHSDEGANSDFYHSLTLRGLEFAAGYVTGPAGLSPEPATRYPAAIPFHRASIPFFSGGPFRLTVRRVDGRALFP